MRTGFIFLISLFILASCGEKSKEADKLPGKAPEPKSLAEAEANWKDYDGIGPVAAFSLPETVDDEMATKGKEIFDAKCTACHKPTEKSIGPAPKGIMEKRNPSWVMNMILNPTEMTQKDPLAKQLLIEFNMSPMANQNLTEEDARAVLEYFRTL